MDYFISLFSDENQYVTWSLVFLGWIITAIIAYCQFQKNKELTQMERNISNHNENVALLKDKISSYEESSLGFWTSKKDDEQDPQLTLLLFANKLKELTDLSREIERFNGVKYPARDYMDLRMFTTNDQELVNRPLDISSNHINIIRTRCRTIKRLYKFREFN